MNTDTSWSKLVAKFIDELLDHAPQFTLVLGALLLVIAALGGIPIGNSPPRMDPGWQYVVAGAGSILLIVGLILVVNSSKSPDKKMVAEPISATPTNETVMPGEQVSSLTEKFAKSGLAHAYRIPVDNLLRENRVRELISQEMRAKRKLRLVASSGFSYLNPNGKVWIEAGLGKLIMNGEIEITAVLESPFSSFAITRAVANKVDHHHWQEKQQPPDLVELLQYPNVTLKVTEEAVNCSLFLTSQAVFYDPYLWALPAVHNRTENKFWVFEFDRVNDSDYDCYGLLEKHFEFLLLNSVPLEEVLHTPKNGTSTPRGKDFYLFFKNNPTNLALNKYYSLTKSFETKVRIKLDTTR